MRQRVALALCATLSFTALAVLAGCGQVGGPKFAGQPTEQARSMQQMLADINQIRAFTYGSGDQAAAQASADDLVSGPDGWRRCSRPAKPRSIMWT